MEQALSYPSLLAQQGEGAGGGLGLAGGGLGGWGGGSGGSLGGGPTPFSHLKLKTSQLNEAQPCLYAVPTRAPKPASKFWGSVGRGGMGVKTMVGQFFAIGTPTLVWPLPSFLSSSVSMATPLNILLASTTGLGPGAQL